MELPAHSLRSWLRVLPGPAMAGLISVLCYRVYGVNATTAGFAYLLGILGVAAVWGLIESLVASLAASYCFSYFFLPPIGRPIARRDECYHRVRYGGA